MHVSLTLPLMLRREVFLCLKQYIGVSYISSSSAQLHVDYMRVHTSHVLLRMRTSGEIRSALCKIRGYVDARWWPPPPRGNVWHCVHHSVLYMLACIFRDGLPIANDWCGPCSWSGVHGVHLIDITCKLTMRLTAVFIVIRNAD